jgi:hypothetical protein
MAKVHRAYRHSWWRRSKEITTRDYQAMCTFAENHVRLEAIAEHFGCSEAHVEEAIVLTNHYGYRARRLFSSKQEDDLGPDRADALRTFQQVVRRMESGEMRHEMTWQEYLDTVDWSEAYKCYGDRAVDVVMEKAQEIAAKSNLELIFAD